MSYDHTRCAQAAPSGCRPAGPRPRRRASSTTTAGWRPSACCARRRGRPPTPACPRPAAWAPSAGPPATGRWVNRDNNRKKNRRFLERQYSLLTTWMFRCAAAPLGTKVTPTLAAPRTPATHHPAGRMESVRETVRFKLFSIQTWQQDIKTKCNIWLLWPDRGPIWRAANKQWTITITEKAATRAISWAFHI